jgi:hypothetical protein
MRNTVINILERVPATITDGQSQTPPVDLGGLRLFGIVVPPVWTAASLTFQVSFDGGANWADMYDINGNELTAHAEASCYIAIDPVNFAAVPMLKVRSGTSSAPVNQEQDATLQLVLRAV